MVKSGRQGSTLKKPQIEAGTEKENGCCKEVRGIFLYLDERDV